MVSEFEKLLRAVMDATYDTGYYSGKHEDGQPHHREAIAERCSATQRLQACVKALVEAARAVNHTFYGMLLREWGVSENWPADAHGKVVYEQLRDILAQWGVSDG